MRDSKDSTGAGARPAGYKKPLAVVLMALALVYDVVPTDIISDFMVFVGWSDDLVLTTLAAFNLVKRFDMKLGGVVKWVAAGVVLMLLSSAALVTYLFIRLGMYLFGGGPG